MNGVAEQLLQDLLAQAQSQTALLQRLAGSFTGGAGGGGGGVAGATASLASLTPVGRAATMALSAVNAAANLVSTVLGKLGSIVGYTIGQFVNLGINIVNFAKKAAQGTAMLSDFFDIFKNLPVLGSIAGIFADIMRISEGLLKTYQRLTNAGASFGGDLFEMGRMAARAYLTLDEFGKIVLENSEVFATLGSNVQDGLNKFVEANAALMGPGSPYSRGILGLGITSQEAAGYLTTVVKSQGAMGKRDAASSQQLAKFTAEYVQELDMLSKITGKRREQIDAEVRKAQDDQVWQLYLDSLSPEKAEAARSAITQAMAVGGKDLADVVKAQLRGIDAPLTDAAKQFAVASGGLSVEMGQTLRDIMNQEGLTAQQRDVLLLNAFGKTALGVGRFADAIGTTNQAVLGSMLPQTLLQFARNIKESGGNINEAIKKTLAQQNSQASGNAATLAQAQQNIKIFGSRILDIFYTFISPIASQLAIFGESLLGTITHLMGSDGFKAAIEKVKEIASSVYSWFVLTFTELANAKPEEFWTKLGDKLGEAYKNVGDFLKPVWNTIQPVLERKFNELVDFLKPYFQTALDSILETLRNALHEQFPKIFSPSQKYIENKISEAGPAFTAWQRERESSIGGRYTKEHASSPESYANYLYSEWIKKKEDEKDEWMRRSLESSGRSSGVIQQRHSGTLGMTGNWWEKSDALLNVKAGESVVTPEQMAQITGGGQENLILSISQLNNMTAQMLLAMKQTAEYTKRNYDAIKAIDGNQFATV